MRLAAISTTRKLLEGLGTVEYVPPTKPMQLMADFYILQFLETGPKYTTSHRQAELDYEVQSIKKILIPYLRRHLIAYAGYSIVSEFMHLWTGTVRIAGGRRKLEAILAAAGMPEDVMEELEEGALQDYPPDLDLANLQIVAKLGVKLFNTKVVRWAEDYGGKPWQLACEAWLHLDTATTLNHMSVWIDRIYDLQHNTGNLLNKNPEYDGHWVQHLLDLKFNAQDPRDLIPFASPRMRTIAARVLTARYGVGAGSIAPSRRFDPEFQAEIMEKIRAGVVRLGIGNARTVAGAVYVEVAGVEHIKPLMMCTPSFNAAHRGALIVRGVLGQPDLGPVPIDDPEVVEKMLKLIKQAARLYHKKAEADQMRAAPLHAQASQPT